MSEIYVEPCPFCGSEDISFNAFSISSDAYVLCKQCNASIEISVPWDNMNEREHDKVCFEKLSVLWNNRVSESNQPELNENQQRYLEQLQYNHERLGNTHDALFFGLVDYEKRWNFNDENFAQVLQAFSQWAIEQGEI